MENTTKIESGEVCTGFFIHLECCMCGETSCFGGESKDEVLEAIDETEWVNLDSDEYQVSGFYCGCDYLEEDERSKHLL